MDHLYPKIVTNPVQLDLQLDGRIHCHLLIGLLKCVCHNIYSNQAF